MRALPLILLLAVLPQFPAAAATPVEAAPEDLTLVQDLQDPQDPMGMGGQPEPGPQDAAQNIGKTLVRMLLTALTTCSGLSLCSASAMGCGLSALLILYGFSGGGITLLVAGAVGIGVAVLLGLTSVLVVLPISLVLRYFGLWDTWTEQFVWMMFRILISAF